MVPIWVGLGGPRTQFCLCFYTLSSEPDTFTLTKENGALTSSRGFITSALKILLRSLEDVTNTRGVSPPRHLDPFINEIMDPDSAQLLNYMLM